MEYLVFQLYGPLASWGLPATGETRRSAIHPTRSALIGLLAAALGVRRGDEERLALLRDSVRLAVKQLSPGVLVQDYHTAQVPSQEKNVKRLTRRDELHAPNSSLNTILSTREYRCDGYWKVAVYTQGASPWDLQTLCSALRCPHFPLYIGRKSCPLGAPLAPQIIESEGIRGALATPFPAFTEDGSEIETRLLNLGASVAYAWEGDGGDISPQETRYPQDQPLHRGRWQFGVRPEYWHHTTEES
jgi:CRISPR system Cascade subunit CasD